MMRGFALVVTGSVVVLAGLAPHVFAEPVTFAMDRAHSEVGFNVRHFFTKAHGRFEDYTANIVFDPKDLAASSVAVTIRDSSVYTGNARRDSHLRTADFFWADKYPTITFKSSKVVPGRDANHFQVAGTLTIRDVTKPDTLDVEYFGMGPIGIKGHSLGTQAGFHASTTVNRKDYGIIWNQQLDQGGLMLGDDVDIELTVAAVNMDEPAAKPATAGNK